MNKPTVIYFYQYLPPWRIDVFNEMGKFYNLTIVFTNADCEGFTYNRKELLNKLHNINTIFLNNGFTIGTKPVRLGIANIIYKLKPDIIFSHEYSPTSILIALYKQLRIFHYKYVITTSDNVQIANSVHGIKALCRKYILKNSDGIIVYSKSVKQWYTKKFPSLSIDICPNIQNPITLLKYKNSFPSIIQSYQKKFNLTNQDNLILFIGRLVEVKGIDLMLKAFATAKIDNYKLIIVGSGHLEKELKVLSKKLDLENKVIFAGFYSSANLYAWYDMANYLLLPSRYEPFGAVINEALILGCPVVASKYIGATDFITQNNGIIFDPLNETEFVKVIKQASLNYSGTISKRNNLMPCSFYDYVYSFYKINK